MPSWKRRAASSPRFCNGQADGPLFVWPRRALAVPSQKIGEAVLRSIFGLVLALFVLPSWSAETLVAPPFADHAVLQRDRPIRIWGQAPPNATILLHLAGVSAGARAAGDGHWQAELPPLPAGGPFTLKIESGERSQTLSDILIGDVFLCSGQSNMELQVHRALDSRSEIAGAHNDRIRLMRGASWQPVNPASLADFSAACYFFGRELQKSEPVPIGLIEEALGGANIRSFISVAGLRALGGYDHGLDLLELYGKDPGAAMRRFAEDWQDWWKSAKGDEPWRESAEWPVAPDGPWDEWSDAALARHTGIVFYRNRLTLGAAQAAQGARLSLGALNEEDVTWVDGKPIGVSFGYGATRYYPVPPNLLHSGVNEVTVAVLCTYRGCGLLPGSAQRGVILTDGTLVAFDQPWHYRRPVPHPAPARAPWGSVPGLSASYNAMIAPLGPYGLKAALWYQGESNAGEAGRYKDLLRALIADWRRQFGADLPFLIVQLPNYGAPPTKPGESGWAEIREAQKQVAAEDGHAALAVTIDIGERTDIHPANKQELGRRLARAARHLLYGDPAPASGPVARSASRKGGQVIVRFADVTGGLLAYGAEGPVGFALCAGGACRYATGSAEANQVTLEIPAAMAPDKVRYGWADSPICTLYDGAGLPAGPFELPVASE
jgi:sialate O-acetylesterase